DQIVIISGTDELQNKADRGYFIETQKLQSGEVYISPLNLNRERGQIEEPHVPVIRFGTPVYDPAGNFRGVVISNVYAADFLDRLKASQGQIYLTNRDGFYLSHPDPAQTFGFDLDTDYNVSADFPTIFETLESSDEETYATMDATRKEMIVLQKLYFDPLQPERHWIMIKTLPQNEVTGTADQLGLLMLAMTVIIAFIIATAAFLLARLLTKQIGHITETFSHVEAGNLTKRSPIISHDELGQMAKDLNNLLDNLQERIETEAELRKVEQEAIK
ncbi:MAG: HAMP domain-containing protein, partial [bacterium]|nr:HAMP domain-containing protein [bacterium]